MNGPLKPELGLSGAVRQVELKPPWSRSTCRYARSVSGSSSEGGPVELEQKDSADPPLAVYGVYRGRHSQHHGHSTEEVQHRGGPLGGGPALLSLFHRSVLVRV